MKTEFRQVFDEAKEKWVLRKVKPDDLKRCRVLNSTPFENYEVRCLNCGCSFGWHFIGHGGYIACDTSVTPVYFEYLA